nr:hypothetical protein Iba_scaffold699137CG0010 [Ipomoea batatas]GMD76109.1 hypothetical protein Iba_chr13bCG7180 [Ipomoea batatas]GME11777.1 hypothetical protein Iba_scaffold12351CG0010 [Ipomoea batatas]GME20169.1 hypothetical protein Iba_scaffold24398CG0030 [Ipomoea batatas]
MSCNKSSSSNVCRMCDAGVDIWLQGRCPRIMLTQGRDIRHVHDTGFVEEVG